MQGICTFKQKLNQGIGFFSRLREEGEFEDSEGIFLLGQEKGDHQGQVPLCVLMVDISKDHIGLKAACGCPVQTLPPSFLVIFYFLSFQIIVRKFKSG